MQFYRLIWSVVFCSFDTTKFGETNMNMKKNNSNVVMAVVACAFLGSMIGADVGFWYGVLGFILLLGPVLLVYDLRKEKGKSLLVSFLKKKLVQNVLFSLVLTALIALGVWCEFDYETTDLALVSLVSFTILLFVFRKL